MWCSGCTELARSGANMNAEPKACCGVDFSERGLIAVRGARSGRGVQLQPATDSLPPPGDEAAIAAALPAHEGFLRRIVAPFPSVAKAQKVFASILDIQLPFPIERCVHRFLHAAPIAGGQVEALAVAARHEDLAARLEKFRAAGVDPTHLDFEPLALWTQSVEEAPLDLETPRVVLYVGTDRTTLAFGRGTRCLGGHAIRAGAAQLFEGDGLPGMALRVRQLVQAQWREEAEGPMQWALCGPGLDAPGRADALKAALARSESAHFFTHKQPGALLARALATRALAQGAYRCNLREGAFEHPRMAALREGGLRRAAVALLAAGLMVCALNVAWRVALSSQKQHFQDQLSALASEVSGMERVPRGQELVIAERAAGERKAALQPLLDTLVESPVSRLAAVMAGATGRFTLDSATAGAQAMVLAGRAASWDDAEQAAASLREAGWKVSLDRGDAGADDRVPFTIKAVP